MIREVDIDGNGEIDFDEVNNFLIGFFLFSTLTVFLPLVSCNDGKETEGD